MSAIDRMVDRISDSHGIDKIKARKIVCIVFHEICFELMSEARCAVPQFGTFSVSERAASEGRHPRTGEKIQIAASKKATFKMGKALKAKLNPELELQHAAPGTRSGPPTPRKVA